MIHLLLLFSAVTSANAETIYDKAARISCDMVTNQQIHWAEKARLRRAYFVAIYDEFETNKYTNSQDLKWSLPACD